MDYISLCSLSFFLCSGWRKRYFILENGVLMYYMNANSPHCKGSVNLLTSVIVVPKRDSHRFEIDTGVGILHLRAKVNFHHIYKFFVFYVDAPTTYKNI
jgi:hypothetical protein